MIRIKICGITTPADIVAACDLSADAIGLNFYPKSPRYVTPSQGRELVRHFRPFVAPVGVFVTDDFAEVQATAFQAGLRAVQTYSELPRQTTFEPIAHIPAFRVKNTADLDQIRILVAAIRPIAVLVDSYVVGEMGGTGHKAPWELLVGFDPGVPLILAGGLTPENVADAIQLVKPWGVDVASGVESAPGIKDHGKMRAFIEAARSSATTNSMRSANPDGIR
jgi:phosphoribosylanthranilate isomerase